MDRLTTSSAAFNPGAIFFTDDKDMNQLPHVHRGDMTLPLVLDTALACTQDTWAQSYKHLPVLVRFRACGALRAWQVVLDSLEGASRAAAALSTPSVSVMAAERALRALALPRIRFGAGSAQSDLPMLMSMLRFSAHALCFWLRSGALYEPTPALGTLLGGSDIAKDLPFLHIVPPAAAMCALVPFSQRQQCADASAIAVFTHDADDGSALRELTLLSFHPAAVGGKTNLLVLPVRDEADLLCSAVRNAQPSAYGVPLDPVDAAAMTPSYDSWERILDYLAKVLLYLQLDQPVLRHVADHTNAPRQFSGLGRRKRETKLQLVEQLYDRYIVGPESLTETLGGRHCVGGPGEHELPAHWRRGHFRLQPHGPKSSLRKVLFIPPTIVRADRLGSIVTPSQPGSP